MVTGHLLISLIRSPAVFISYLMSAIITNIKEKVGITFLFLFIAAGTFPIFAPKITFNIFDKIIESMLNVDSKID